MMSNQDKLNLIKECFDKYDIDETNATPFEYFTDDINAETLGSHSFSKLITDCFKKLGVEDKIGINLDDGYITTEEVSDGKYNVFLGLPDNDKEDNLSFFVDAWTKPNDLAEKIVNYFDNYVKSFMNITKSYDEYKACNSINEITNTVMNNPDTRIIIDNNTYIPFNLMDSNLSSDKSKIYYCNMDDIDDPSLSEDYFVVNVSLNKINNNEYEGIKSIDSIDDYTINNSIDKMVKNNDVSETHDKEMDL